MATPTENLLGQAIFRTIAQRVCLFKSPEEVLARPYDFLCRVMALGLWDAWVYTEGLFGEQAFSHALTQCGPGIMDEPSWHYWHHRLGRETIPPMPQRTFA